MLKHLISALTSNKVDVSAALKKSKLILTIQQDEELSNFIINELEGYTVDNVVPPYRTLIGSPKGHYRNKFTGRLMVIPLNFYKINEQTGINFNERRIIFSIVEIEVLLKKSTEGNGEICLGFTPDQLRLLWEDTNAENDNGWFLENAWWAFSENLFRKIYSQTENKLLDIIVRLNKENPNLDSQLKFMEEQEKNQSIQTNFHGNIIASNLGIGNDITQKDIIVNYNKDIKDIIEKIIALGFEKQDTAELEKLLVEQRKTGSNIGKQLLGWIGKMTTKAIEKGIEYKIPELTTILGNYF